MAGVVKFTRAPQLIFGNNGGDPAFYDTDIGEIFEGPGSLDLKAMYGSTDMIKTPLPIIRIPGLWRLPSGTDWKQKAQEQFIIVFLDMMIWGTL